MTDIKKGDEQSETVLTKEQEALATERVTKGLCPVCGKALYWECNGPSAHL